MSLQQAIYTHTLKNRSQTAFNLNEQDRSNWDKRFKNTSFFIPKESSEKKKFEKFNTSWILKVS